MHCGLSCRGCLQARWPGNASSPRPDTAAAVRIGPRRGAGRGEPGVVIRDSGWLAPDSGWLAPNSRRDLVPRTQSLRHAESSHPECTRESARRNVPSAASSLALSSASSPSACRSPRRAQSLRLPLHAFHPTQGGRGGSASPSSPRPSPGPAGGSLLHVGLYPGGEVRDQLGQQGEH